MKTFVATVVACAIAAGPAYAQLNKGNPPVNNPSGQFEAAQAARERARVEREYDDTVKRMRTDGPAAPKADPWGAVRPAAGADGKR